MKFQQLATILILFVSYILIGSAKAEETFLKIHAVDYPPYEIENPNADGLVGFDVEVITEAFRRVGRRVVVEFRPWKRIVAMAKTGTSLAILSCSKNTERDGYIYYSDPISTATRTYVASNLFDAPVPKTIDDVQGLKVTVVGGYGAEKELVSANIKYSPAKDDGTALNILLKRNYDLFYSGREFIQYVAGGMGISDQLQYFDMNKQVSYHLCFSKKWPSSKQLRDLFNVGLAKVRADGNYNVIHDKYK